MEKIWGIRRFIVNTSNWSMGRKFMIAPEQITGVHGTDKPFSVEIKRKVVKAASLYEPFTEWDRYMDLDLYRQHGRVGSRSDLTSFF